MKTTRRHLVAGTSALAVATATGIRATTVAAQDVTTINWWHITTNEEEAAHMQKAADDYMAANPDVQIEITVQENDAFKTTPDHGHAVRRTARHVPELGWWCAVPICRRWPGAGHHR